jgi:hypothetical protein
MLGFHHREFSAQLANSRRDFLAELGPDFPEGLARGLEHDGLLLADRGGNAPVAPPVPIIPTRLMRHNTFLLCARPRPCDHH